MGCRASKSELGTESSLSDSSAGVSLRHPGCASLFHPGEGKPWGDPVMSHAEAKGTDDSSSRQGGGLCPMG